MLQSSTPSTSTIKVDNYTYISEQIENRVVTTTGIFKLKQDMGFNQLRYYCHKKSVGRTFHIMTNRNYYGYKAVRYAIENPSPRAKACGSFTALPDDNSKISQHCKKWGVDKSRGEVNMIGHSSYTGSQRLYHRFAFWKGYYYTGFQPNTYWCDDDSHAMLSVGDVFEIYVR